MLIKTHINSYWLYKCYVYLHKLDLSQQVQHLWDRLDHRSRPDLLVNLPSSRKELWPSMERKGCSLQDLANVMRCLQVTLSGMDRWLSNHLPLLSSKKTQQFSSLFYTPVWAAFSLIPRFCRMVSRDSCQSCQTQNVPLAISSLPPAIASAAPAIAEQQLKVIWGQLHILKHRFNRLCWLVACFMEFWTNLTSVLTSLSTTHKTTGCWSNLLSHLPSECIKLHRFLPKALLCKGCVFSLTTLVAWPEEPHLPPLWKLSSDLICW